MPPRTLAALVIALVLASSTALALPRHVNPDTAPEDTPPPIVLALMYGTIVEQIAKGNFSATLELIERGLGAHIPPALRLVYEKTLELFREVSLHINKTEALLSEAELLVEGGLLTNASECLSEAENELLLARAKTKRLERAFEELGRRLPAISGRLAGELSKLEEVVTEFEKRLERVKAEIEALKAKGETRLELTVSPLEARPGDTVRVRGTLTSVKGEPLASQLVEVYAGGERVSLIMTDSHGAFETLVRLPEVYAPWIELYAVYRPPPDSRYAACTSKKVRIRLVYSVLEVELECPRVVVPGSALEVRGAVTLEGAPFPCLVVVTWLGRERYVMTGDDGTFQVTLLVPSDLKDGRYELSVRALGRRGIAPGSARVSVRVARIPLEVRVWPVGPLLVGGIAVTGVVEARGKPVPRAVVLVEAEDARCSVLTDESGRFYAAFTPPLLSLSGPREVRVVAEPPLPIYREGEAMVSVLYLNPLLAGLLPLAAAIVLLIPRAPVRYASETPVSPGSAPRVTMRLSRHGFQALWWRIAMYAERVTGIKVRHWHTLREYTRAVAGRLGVLGEVFWTVCILAERQLYSARKPSMDVLERLRRVVQRYIRGGESG